MNGVSSVKSSEVRGETYSCNTEEDTEGRPQLPSHDQATSNGRRHVFCSKDGHRRAFGSHTNTEEKTTDEEF